MPHSARVAVVPDAAGEHALPLRLRLVGDEHGVVVLKVVPVVGLAYGLGATFQHAALDEPVRADAERQERVLASGGQRDLQLGVGIFCIFILR